jgi:hypothetical protein
MQARGIPRGCVMSPASKPLSCAASRVKAAQLCCLPRQSRGAVLSAADLGGLVEGIELGEDLGPQVAGGDVTAAAAVQQ